MEKRRCGRARCRGRQDGRFEEGQAAHRRRRDRAEEETDPREQIDYLCERLRLLNCFQMGQPGGSFPDEKQYAEPCGMEANASWGLPKSARSRDRCARRCDRPGGQVKIRSAQRSDTLVARAWFVVRIHSSKSAPAFSSLPRTPDGRQPCLAHTGPSPRRIAPPPAVFRRRTGRPGDFGSSPRCSTTSLLGPPSMLSTGPHLVWDPQRLQVNYRSSQSSYW
jgi:hypothetical protein